MSTFAGKTKEYPEMSIDRFDKENLQNYSYFLSHNHKDHTVGLFSEQFIYRLQSQQKIKLYCSDVTKDLLLVDVLLQKYIKKCPGLSKSIVGLPTEKPTKMPLIDPDTGQELEELFVTLLPAGHCPGSIMFLFEGSRGNILYTGDFRLTQYDIRNMQQLRSGNSVKAIESMYIDTTFCVPQMKVLPSRKESARQVVDIIEKWISKGPEYLIYILHKADLGYEQLYTDVALYFNTKVHVACEKFDEYKNVGDMQNFTTSNPIITKIHACGCPNQKRKTKASDDRHHSLPCGYKGSNMKRIEVCTIKVSAMHFVNKLIPNTQVEKINDHYYRVLYSFHSSYAEVRDFVTYIKPNQVFPNVVPDKHTKHEVQERLNRFLEVAKANDKAGASQEVKALGKMKVKSKPKRKISCSQQSDDFDFAQCTPEKKRAKNIEEKKSDSRGEDEMLNENTKPNKKQKIKEEKIEFPLLFGGNSDSDSADDIDNDDHLKENLPDSEEISDRTKFPLLFGGTCDSEGEDHHEEDHSLHNDFSHKNHDSNASDEESNFHSSQSLFSEDDLLPEDKELIRGLSPQIMKSDTDSEMSDVIHEGEMEEIDECNANNDMITGISKDSKSRTLSYSFDSQDLCRQDDPKGQDTSHSSSLFESCSPKLGDKGEDKNINNKLKKKSETSICEKEDKLSNCPKNNTIDCKSVEKGDNRSNKCSEMSGGNGVDLEESIEIVKVVEGHSSDSVEMEQVFYRSSRERYISESLDDYQKASKSEKGNTPEEIQRPSVVRYPTSGFYSSVTLDKTHAAQGYHNMITNIDKILKSPTKVSDESDNCDIVVLGKRDVAEDLSMKKPKRSKAECTKVRPDSNETIDTTHDSFDSTFKSNQIKPDIDILNSSSDTNVGTSKKDNVCIDLTNEEDDEVNDDISHVSNCSTEEVWSGTDIVSSAAESDGDAQHDPNKAVNKDKHKKLRKRKSTKGDYLSDSSDSDCEGYSSDEWYVNVHDIKSVSDHAEAIKLLKSSDRSKTLKNNNGKVVLPDEVIVLDDSSNGSVAQNRSTQTPLNDLQLGPSPAKLAKLSRKKGEKLLCKNNNNKVELTSSIIDNKSQNNNKEWKNVATVSSKKECEFHCKGLDNLDSEPVNLSQSNKLLSEESIGKMKDSSDDTDKQETNDFEESFCNSSPSKKPSKENNNENVCTSSVSPVLQQ